MELKINREMLNVSESIYDGSQEQSVELDYILPDYCPDIFRLVKCCVMPSVVSWSINDNILSYELLADIRILYCSENSPAVQCINQKMTFNKTLRLESSPASPVASLIPKTDHINCRAVNQRRIDMRGAVSVKIRVTGERPQEVVCDIFGMNSQVRKKPVEFASKKLCASKQLSVSEDFELNASDKPVSVIAKVSASAEVTEKKIIANKLVVKGEAKIGVLYSSGDGLETIRFPVAFSQIVDMEGLDDSFLCSVSAEAVSCDITPCADSSGDTRILKCELRINLGCQAVKSISAELVTDVYSTSYPCEYAVSKLKLQHAPSERNDVIQKKVSIESGGVFECIYDVWCTPKNINTAIDPENGCICISGMLEYCVMYKGEGGMPAVTEKSEAFEHKLEAEGITESSCAELNVNSCDCTYTIASPESVSVSAELKISGCIRLCDSVEAVTEVTFDDSVKKIRDGDYALKLYYGIEGEDVWEIAKRYSTSVRAVMEENELDSELLSESGMLLIPIV